MSPSDVNESARRFMASLHFKKTDILVAADTRVTEVEGGFRVVVGDREFFIPEVGYNHYCNGLKLAIGIIEHIEKFR